MCLLGALAEKIICWKFGKFRAEVLRQESQNFFSAIFYSSVGSLIELLGVALFAAVGLAVSLLLPGLTPLMVVFLQQYFLAIIVFRIVYVLSNSLLAPKNDFPRVIKLSDSDSKKFHSWVLVFTAIYAFGFFTSQIWIKGGMPPEIVSLLRVFLIGLPLIIILLLFVWLNLVQQNEALSGRLSLAWWLTLTFPIVDRVIHRLLLKIVSIRWLQSRTFKTRSTRFVVIIQTTIRVFIILLAAITFIEACGVGVFAILGNELSQKIISGGIDVLIIALCAYTTWEIIQSIVESKMPETDGDSSLNLEGERGALERHEWKRCCPCYGRSCCSLYFLQRQFRFFIVWVCRLRLC